ncbi:MAG: hypothetical protein IKK43_00375 [Clostridia bacterium]|nr:hypothetical protein [Clostridia bacterium]
MNYKEKNKLADKLCGVGIMLIFVEICISMIQTMCINAMYDRITMKTISCAVGAVFLLIAIVLYVFAYKKSSGSKAVWATEFVALAFTVPFIVHVYAFAKSDFIKSIPVRHVWIPFFVYYVGKAIYVIIKANKNSSSRKKK